MVGLGETHLAQLQFLPLAPSTRQFATSHEKVLHPPVPLQEASGEAPPPSYSSLPKVYRLVAKFHVLGGSDEPSNRSTTNHPQHLLVENIDVSGEFLFLPEDRFTPGKTLLRVYGQAEREKENLLGVEVEVEVEVEEVRSTGGVWCRSVSLRLISTFL